MWLSGKEPACQCRRHGFDPWVGKIPWRGKLHPTPVLLPGKSHGWRSLVGCSPWGREELDTTEQLHFHFSLSCIGEGNGNLLQCSCLENPRDRGAWWAVSMGSHRVGHDWSNLVAAGFKESNIDTSYRSILIPAPGRWNGWYGMI